MNILSLKTIISILLLHLDLCQNEIKTSKNTLMTKNLLSMKNMGSNKISEARTR